MNELQKLQKQVWLKDIIYKNTYDYIVRCRR